MSLIIAALRTAVVPRGGAFSSYTPWQLATPVIHQLLNNAGIKSHEVDQLICGNAIGGGGNLARMIAQDAGLNHLSGITVDSQCTSGIEAMVLAHALIDSGQAEIVIAGGSESFSQRPLRAWQGEGLCTPEFYLRPPFNPNPDADPELHIAAGNLALSQGYSRTQMDNYAVESHHRAYQARERIAQEIVAVAGMTQDCYARKLTQKLAARTPLLSHQLSVAATAIEADGAAFSIMVAPHIARRLDCDFALNWLGNQSIGADSRQPALAPIYAIEKLLRRYPNIEEGQLWIEIMEAYAPQAIACIEAFCFDKSRINIGGGALARGHPIAASGNILVCRLWHELRQHGGEGLIAIAGAGGIASALLLGAVAHF